MSHKNVYYSNRYTQLEIYAFKNATCFLQSSTVKTPLLPDTRVKLLCVHLEVQISLDGLTPWAA